MFSALKKLTSSKNDATGVSIPESVGQTMSDSLRKKFSKGVQYNMKVIIKGDRNVGKSCLFERLQGKAFLEQYTPTDQIQVTSIQWSFKATDDIVKVEVWDVVDRGKSRPKSGGLKLNTGNGAGASATVPDQPVLDAEFLDVYKGTHCVIMMMDITKAWTFDYVARELPKVPKDIPILLLGNHCDMGHHRVISKDQVTGLIEEIQVEHQRTSEIIYGESSMRNGFGLRLLHKFLGIPFLYLQKCTLEASLKKNACDIDICVLEINEFIKSDDANYSVFMDNLINKRRQGTSTATNETAVKQILSEPSTPVTELKPTKSIIIGGGRPIVIPEQQSQLKQSQSMSNALNVQKAIDIVATTSATVISGGTPIKLGTPTSAVVNVDEFCPDGGVLDKSFLDDGAETSTTSPNTLNLDSDSDDEGQNPLVARFDDDLNISETVSTTTTRSSLEQKDEKLRKNPLCKSTKNDNTNEAGATSMTDKERKLSLSSFEIDMTKEESNPATNDEFDDNWSLDTKMRRSPEGGEDIVSTTSSLHHHTNRVTSILAAGEPSLTEISEKKSPKDKDKKHKKKKSKDKDKDKSDKEKSERRKKSSKKKDNIDEFLNEMKITETASANTGDYADVDDAYEAL
uniref:Putative rab n=1 Tax=Corethrella appendiculata TaxID=1370023 RepID=U5EVA4_9DIPT